MMRTRFLLSSALVLLAAAPAAMRAQFQPPNPDELKMTTDPKAPGADAVILDNEETDSDQAHAQNYYIRIKVLTEKGKDAATVEIPYLGGDFSIGEIRGRTIHADGTIVPLTSKPEDLLIVRAEGVTVKRKVFNMPGVEVGSVLELSYQLRFNDQFWFHRSPEWDVQRKYFVHKAHFQFTPYAGAGNVVCWPHLPAGATVKNNLGGLYTLDMTDIPPAPDEEWMPPIDSFLFRVLFYYSGRPVDATDFWIPETKEWSEEVDKYAAQTDSLRAAVGQIVAPGDSDLDKAKKLYAAVQALDNTDYSRSKTESERRVLHLKDIKRAEDTWKQKSGDSNEIAYLYLAMLRAAGLTAYAMQVVDRKYELFDPSYFNFDQLDVALVVLSTGGKETVLDPGEKLCPFGQLSWRHSEARGVRQASDAPSLMTTPPENFNDNMTTYNANITLDGKGAMTGSFTIVMSGQAALYWRQVALESDLSEVKSQYDKELESMVPEGVEAHVDQFMGLDHAEGSLIAMVKASGTVGTAMAKRILLPGYFFATRGREPFVNEAQRQEPVDMHFAERVNENVTYHIPDGYTVEGAPQDAKVAWPGHAILATKCTPGEGQVQVVYSIVRGFALAQADEYQDLRGFYQKVAATDQEQLVLASAGTTAGKGN
jgi:Domain of Unknown Function with PDB structure (DUF3857)/Transglutaminase-like superfamily